MKIRKNNQVFGSEIQISERFFLITTYPLYHFMKVVTRLTPILFEHMTRQIDSFHTCLGSQTIVPSNFEP